MAMFRSKPTTIKAKQWFPPGDSRHDPSMLSHRKGNQVDPPDYRQTGDIYCFGDGQTGEFGGHMFFIRVGGPNDNVQIRPGDWIVTGVKGEKYPIKPDIFTATYEPCPPGPPAPPTFLGPTPVA